MNRIVYGASDMRACVHACKLRVVGFVVSCQAASRTVEQSNSRTCSPHGRVRAHLSVHRQPSGRCFIQEPAFIKLNLN